MKIGVVSALLSRHLNPMGARTQTAIARKGGATIGILDVEITRDSSKWPGCTCLDRNTSTNILVANRRPKLDVAISSPGFSVLRAQLFWAHSPTPQIARTFP